jgi:hypothetical protein
MNLIFTALTQIQNPLTTTQSKISWVLIPQTIAIIKENGASINKINFHSACR